MNDIGSLSAYDYELPRELIAQHPAERRDASRLMVVERQSGTIGHDVFRSLPNYLRSHDLLVLNNTRVRPAKVCGRRATGGRIEALLLREISAGTWEALLKCRRPLREGEPLAFEEGRITGQYRGRTEQGRHVIELHAGGGLQAALERYGRVPLPPYIHRDERDAFAEEDRERYQTIFAERPGAIAAPTAGLHFTDELFEALREKGIARAYVTLHVGPGTFMPVKAERINEHRMEAEQYEVPPETASAIGEASQRGGRIVVVGTTCCRALESAAAASPQDQLVAGAGWSELFIRPPYTFRCSDALITNFHLPRSTLLMLVSALAGRELVMRAYAEAVRLRYRFYSYGDAMLIV